METLSQLTLSGVLYWELDAWIILIGILGALNTALLGHFLVLKKMSMVSDAISHSVLPGIALAFILFGSRNDSITLIFAALCGVILVVLFEILRKKGKVDEGTALGVPFIGLFAIGLILIVSAADYVDLDPACVLFGNLELAPLLVHEVLGVEVPGAIVSLSILLLVNTVFILFFYKELLLSSFDEVYAETQGMRPALFHYAFLILLAITTVLCFEIFGTILVVALYVVPIAAAHLVSRKSRMILLLGMMLAAVSVVLGHASAVFLPRLVGFESTNSSGMIAVFSGFVFLILLLLSPSQGILTSVCKRQIFKFKMHFDDHLADLYRLQEVRQDHPEGVCIPFLWAKLAGYIVNKDGRDVLSDKGMKRAEGIIRSHRLWETYLSDEAGYGASKVHPLADGFEHYTDRELQASLQNEAKNPHEDPHGKKIP